MRQLGHSNGPVFYILHFSFKNAERCRDGSAKECRNKEASIQQNGDDGMQQK